MKTLLTLFSFLLLPQLYAQLDSIHWFPPMHSRSAGEIEDHYMYLSTPSVTPITVTITDGGGTVLATPIISNGSPFSYLIGADDPSTAMIAASDLNTVLTDRGLILSSTKEFYALFKARSANQAGALTCKGMAARGLKFRAGVMPQDETVDDFRRNFVLSVMATEDGTVVTISDFDTDVEFEDVGGNITDDILNFGLDSGECYVVSGYNDVIGNREGFVGALVRSNKPIVVNNGSWCGGINAGVGQDIGIDQSVPVETLGKEYITIRGEGTDEMEKPLVIAHYDNTQVYVNGSTIPEVNLDAGEWYLIPESNFTGTGHENMYIETSKDAYVYQLIGGAASAATPGMNFIPPISCFMTDSVDLMPSIDVIGSSTYSATIIAFTEAGATLSVNGIPQTGGEAVAGASAPGWETYKISGFSGDVVITSTGRMAAGTVGSSAAAGFSTYYSGFGLQPLISYDLSGCAPETSLDAGSNYSSWQWLLNGNEIPGATSQVINANSPGLYEVVVSEGGCLDTATSVFIPACETTAGISKKVSDFMESGANIYDVEYTISVENFGPSTLFNVQVIDSLTAPPCASVSVLSSPTLSAGLDPGSVNIGFDPSTSNKTILLGIDSLPFPSSDTIKYILRYDLSAAGCQGAFINKAFLSATEIGPNNGTFPPYENDISVDGWDPDPDGNNNPIESSNTIICLPLLDSTSIHYLDTVLVLSDPVQTVTIDGWLDGSFSVFPLGLAVDPLSGEIDPSTASPGYYTVTYSFGSDECAGTAQVTIVIDMDSDGDGVGDFDDLDDDNDGIPDSEEDLNLDGDGDPNTDPTDTDGDGIPDHLDLDSDGDGIADILEGGGTDIDGDGLVDNFTDLDEDGLDDNNPLLNPPDTDSNGTPDFQDEDSDGDGVPDMEEFDPNLDSTGPDDTDGDGIPDYQDSDDDNDGVPTIDEADVDGQIGYDDCDDDGQPDYLDIDQCDFVIPSSFSPNGDGINDWWTIQGIDQYPDHSILVFNRWGQKVFEQTGGPFVGWDGQAAFGVNAGSGILPTGTYYYVVDLGDGSDPLKGTVYLKQ